LCKSPFARVLSLENCRISKKEGIKESVLRVFTEKEVLL
jgi:hypothetical protein